MNTETARGRGQTGELCPRCGMSRMKPNEDGDPSCFICGHVALVVSEWAVTEDAVPRARRRRLQSNGVTL